MRLLNHDGVTYVSVQDYIDHINRSISMVELMAHDGHPPGTTVINVLTVTRDHLTTLLPGDGAA